MAKIHFRPYTTSKFCFFRNESMKILRKTTQYVS